MEIEFDPAKDERNIAKHGLSLHVLAFTDGSHDDAVRAISLRPAEKHEARFYYGQI